MTKVKLNKFPVLCAITKSAKACCDELTRCWGLAAASAALESTSGAAAPAAAARKFRLSLPADVMVQENPLQAEQSKQPTAESSSSFMVAAKCSDQGGV
jgi:hypothetical protein